MEHRDAYVKDPSGTKIIDFKKSNLHVPEFQRSGLGEDAACELRLASLQPARAPDWIPYKTSYYQDAGDSA